MTDSPLLLAVDGNSLLHRAYHGMRDERFVDAEGRGVWALRGLVQFLARAAARLRPDGVVVGFDCRVESERKTDSPYYKAQRPDKPAELEDQLDRAPELLRAAGVPVVVPRGLEADDVLASAAALAAGGGWRCMAVTSDRDAFALIDGTTSVLRVIDGGTAVWPVFSADQLHEKYGVRAGQYRDFAALRGDASDNLPGVRGIGAKYAARLLAAYGTVEGAWAALDEGGEEGLRAVVGKRAAAEFAAAAARDEVERTRRLMTMRTDLDLPALDALRLPLGLAAMRAALGPAGINFGPSLWALTGGPPPDEPPPDRLPEPEDPAIRILVHHRVSAAQRRIPAEDQLALF